jgi:aspartate carbamoyltransferase catalytic subunit
MIEPDTMFTKDSGGDVKWARKHLLDIDTFSFEEFDLVLDTANAMQEILSRPIKKVPALRGKTIVTMFYEPSTRTRGSFELAAKNLSADVLNLSSVSSSVTKGENLLDTLHTLEAMGADIVIMRHSLAGAPYLAARHAKASIINGGDGWHAHPTQALLDIYTIKKHKQRIKGLKVVLLGDSRHSRVARSNIWGLVKLGARVILCGPATLLPQNLNNHHISHPEVEVVTDIDQALDEADVVMALRLQKERQRHGLIPDIREYKQFYQLTPERLSRASGDVLVMHPGPVNEDIEIQSSLVRDECSVIDEQVTNGIAVRMAVLYLISGGNKNA